ncbi:basic amino acid ABC transporter substrate-binding protein [Aquibacillus saliphilus]|uniref:basic amino acid ABC transporter substrate-binding protein n=1 Tax=Aquibacillus saliphilus TaxID=1909422 RepID=UPI001CEFB959|nr:basic amino acid ABC transporter substrate-binding protein [Aquibacillus saliphilus]
MKKNLSLVYLIVIGLLVLSACGTSNDEGTNTDEGATDDKPVLQVGTDAAFAPFEYMETGEIVGFDVDLLEAVMNEAGYEYELKNVGWDPMLASVQGGNIDLAIAGITINDDRKETFDFSVPYFESTHMIVFNEGADINSAKDLIGLKVGVQTGTTGAEAAEKIMGKNHEDIAKYETTALAFMSLTNEDVDAVVTDNVVAAEYVKNNPDATVEAITDKENFESEYYGLMFPKDSELEEELSAALTSIIESGKYEKIYNEWFGTDPDVDMLLKAANQ